MSEKSRPITLPSDPLRIALFLLTVITISRVHQHLGLGAFHPALVLAGVAAGYAFLNPRAIALGTLRTWPAWVVGGLGVAACLSVPFGISMGASARYLVDNYSRVLLFALLVMLAARNGRDTMLFVTAYVVACAFLAWMSITVFDLSLASESQALRLGDMYSYDSNDTGLVLVVGLPLCLLVMQSGGSLLRVLAASVLLGSGWAIALTGSRGAFVAMAVMGLAFLLSLERVRVYWRIGVLGALVAALYFAAPTGYWTQMGTLLDWRDDYNWSAEVGRVAIARRGVGYMVEHPLSGIGLDNFSRAEGTLSAVARDAMPGVGVPWNAPHNSYIQAAAELGIPGGTLFLALVFGGMFGMYRLRRRLPPSWENGVPEERFLWLASNYLFLSYLGFAVGAMFLSFAYLDPIYLLSALTAGVYASVRRRLRGSRGPVSHRAMRPSGGMRGALALLGPGDPTRC